MPETTADDILAHYGVKGMRWGKRKAGGSSSEPSRSDLRTMNKAARKEDRTADKTARKTAASARDKSILDARERLDASDAKLTEAKRNYKVEKKQIGSVAAKRAVNAARKEYYDDFDKATMDTGREQAFKLAGEVGFMLLSAAVKK